MYPILWQFGDWIIPAWHFFYAIAGICAYYSLLLCSRRLDLELKPGSIDRLFLLSYALGYAGARLLSMLIEAPRLAEVVWLDFFSIGSMTLYGGLISGALAAMVWAQWQSLSLLRLADLALIPTLLGIFWGRIGCFLNGDDFGVAVSDQLHPPLGSVIFPNLQDGLYRFPVQLWESVFCLCLAVVLWKLIPSSKHYPGRAGTIGILSYASFRFLNEFFRGDERGSLFEIQVISPAQLISLVIGSAWLLWVYYLSRSKRSPS